MQRNSPKMIAVCDSVFRNSIYILIFLLPIFFLPWTSDVLDFNKQALLALLSFISLFAWIVKSLVSGKINFRMNLLHFIMTIMFLILIASTIFSLWPYGSFWGWPQATAESLLTFIGLFAMFMLISAIFSKKEVIRSVILFISSGFLAMIFGILQIFKIFILPFDFLKTVSFNTVGTISSLACFSAILLPISVVLIASSQKLLLRIFAVLVGISGLVLLVLANFPTAWLLVIVVSVLVISLGAKKDDVFDNRWLILPMVFLGLALFSMFLNLRISNLPSLPTEVYLSQKTGIDISLQTLKERAVLGSGPGTFVYDFSKYKDISFNIGNFWDIRFNSAGSNIINMFATTGILGGLSFLALIGSFILLGVNYFLRKQKKPKTRFSENDDEKSTGVDNGETDEKTDNLYKLLNMGVFSAVVALVVGFFLYGTNMVLNFTLFLLLACFAAGLPSLKKEIILKSSSFVTLSCTFIFTIFFIFSLGIFIFEGQRYTAEIYYAKGAQIWQKGNTEMATTFFEKVAGMSRRTDLYWRELAQAYIQNLNSLASRTDLSKEEITSKAQVLINSAINSAKIATDENSKNVANWSVLGFIYQNLIGIVDSTKEWALKSYDEAIKLEPNNPYFAVQKGISILKEASLIPDTDKTAQKSKLLSDAEGEFKKAIGLKVDYALAISQLVAVYQAQGNKDAAKNELETAKKTAPSDASLAFQLGLIYYQDKDYQKAQEELERAVTLSPNYSNALYFLGLTYDELGLKDEAIMIFEKVLKLNPDNQEISKILENLKNNKGAIEEQKTVE